MGNLNHSLDFMWNLWELSWRTRRGFSWKDCAFVANWLRGKGLNKLRAIFEGIYILIFLILDSGFEYMIVLSCAYNSYILTYCKLSIQFNNKAQLPRSITLEWSWISHVWNVVILVGGIYFIERFVCCMTHKEKLSIQWPSSSDFRHYAREFCPRGGGVWSPEWTLVWGIWRAFWLR